MPDSPSARDIDLAVDETCSRFERQFLSGDRPPIEEFLKETDAALRTALLGELIRVECSLRRREGELPTLDDYLPRFVEQESVVREALELDQAAAKRHRIGPYELLKKLGEGRFGSVWKARDTGARRFVALKVLHGYCTWDERARRQFQAEAEAAGKLDHPHVVRLLHYGEAEETDYIAYELVVGRDLYKQVRAERPSPRQAALWCRDLARAVHHAHERGVLHRDLKPANALIDGEGRVRITDFGIAKFTSDASHASVVKTRTGELKGTYPYMSPEQLSGHATEQSDVYGLGATFYHLLTGRPPFTGTEAEIIRQVESALPVSPRQFQADLPLELEATCGKALAKNPADRYHSAAAFAEDLDAYLEGRPVAARTARAVSAWSERDDSRHKSSTARRVVLAGALIGVVLLIVSVLNLSSIGRRSWPSVGPDPDLDAPPIPAPDVPTPPPQPPEFKQATRITTLPAGAQMAFIPLDDFHNRPMIDNAVRCVSGEIVRLAPGVYLVEASIPGLGFHQVWRRVPGEPGKKSNARFPHLDWSWEGDVAVLPPIHIPDDARMAEELELVLVTDRQAQDTARPTGDSARPWDDNGWEPPSGLGSRFWLGKYEVSVAVYRRSGGELIPSHEGRDGEPADNVTWDHAIHCAELLGARLPASHEYEVACRQAGLLKDPAHVYPVPDDPTTWKLVPVDSADDVLAQENKSAEHPLHLVTNAAEWTLTREGPRYAVAAQLPEEVLNSMRVKRRICGGLGDLFLVNGIADLKSFEAWKLRRLEPFGSHCAGLGFRLARSRLPLVVPPPREEPAARPAP